MKLNIEIELTDEEVDYIKYIDSIKDEFGIFEINYYQSTKGNFSEPHYLIESKFIIEHYYEYKHYCTTYLFDEILKQISR